MYIRRHLENTVLEYGKMFGSVLVTGARQVGKSTLLKNCHPQMRYVSFDDALLLEQAVDDPNLFFMDNEPPIIVDEVQYAPTLFRALKLRIDSGGGKGLFFLSGSQQFSMMKNVSESLAGRIGILSLGGLSMRELAGASFREKFLPTHEYITQREASKPEADYALIWEHIYKGGMPELYANEAMRWEPYYSSYIRTYIERDILTLAQVGDARLFLSFMRNIAARTGQQLNKSAVARDVGISAPTVEKWISILEASGLVYRLRPYCSNVIKREMKTPKLYFLNTGLAAYLTGWKSADTIRDGAMAGAYFETFVFTEILKSYYNMGIIDPEVYYFRDREGHEIDFIIEDEGTLYPVEVKKHAAPNKKDCSAFSFLDEIQGKKRGMGCVIDMYERPISLTELDMSLPVWYI